MEHKRRFMAFTTEGFVTCRAEAAFNAIEIEFADVHTNRPVRFNDYSGFTMAAMGSAAAIFASPGDGAPADGGAASVVHYRAFASWAPNADWTMSLPAGEQASARGPRRRPTPRHVRARGARGKRYRLILAARATESGHTHADSVRHTQCRLSAAHTCRLSGLSLLRGSCRH